jgi:hypothetical protein
MPRSVELKAEERKNENPENTEKAETVNPNPQKIDIEDNINNI